MTCALAILKYLPAVLCGSLVVAWIASQYWLFGATVRWPRGDDGLGSSAVYCSFGRVVIAHDRYGDETPKLMMRRHGAGVVWKLVPGSRSPLGAFRYVPGLNAVIWCPIPVLLTLLLPLAIGPFRGFRFPLWSWFAWLTLAAVELAYYVA